MNLSISDRIDLNSLRILHEGINHIVYGRSKKIFYSFIKYEINTKVQLQFFNGINFN